MLQEKNGQASREPPKPNAYVTRERTPTNPDRIPPTITKFFMSFLGSGLIVFLALEPLADSWLQIDRKSESHNVGPHSVRPHV